MRILFRRGGVNLCPRKRLSGAIRRKMQEIWINKCLGYCHNSLRILSNLSGSFNLARQSNSRNNATLWRKQKHLMLSEYWGPKTARVWQLSVSIWSGGVDDYRNERKGGSRERCCNYVWWCTCDMRGSFTRSQTVSKMCYLSDKSLSHCQASAELPEVCVQYFRWREHVIMRRQEVSGRC